MEEVSEALKELPTDEEMKSPLRTEYEKGRADALKEIEQDPESSYAFKRGVEYGKEEALKDLPRWRKCKKPFDGESNTGVNSQNIILCGHYITWEDLEKLPGFKES